MPDTSVSEIAPIIPSKPSASAPMDALLDRVRAEFSAPFAAIIRIADGLAIWERTSGFSQDITRIKPLLMEGAVSGDDVTIVTDCRAANEASDHVLITTAPGIRSLISRPLQDDTRGSIGFLVVYDTVARNWSVSEQAAFCTFATIAEGLLTPYLAQAEQEIARLTRRLQEHSGFMEQVSEVANIGGWSLDISNNELRWTPQTYRIHEVDDDFIPDVETAIDFYAPEVRHVIEAAVEDGLSHGLPWDLELPIVTAKGRRIWVRAQGKCERENGIPVRLVGSVQDITERREVMDNYLNAAAAASRTAANLSSYGRALDAHAIVAITDRKGVITFVNDKFCDISGYDRSELIGKTHSVVNSGHHDREFFKDMWRTIASGASWHGEICNRAKDGTSYWVDTTIVPQYGDGDVIEKYVAIRFDITDRVLKDEKLQRDRETALERADAQSLFLANMSHEIRTPLNGVVGLAGALRQTSLDTEQAEMVELIEKSGIDLRTILSDILDLSKAEAGQIAIEHRPVELRPLIETVVGVHRANAEAKGLELTASVDNALPTMVLCDELRLRQVLSNLLSNAVKFTETGTISIRVGRTAYYDSADQLWIRVQDTGCGLTELQQRRIFDRYVQADMSRTRAFEGTGLGLAICDALMTAMGGNISVASELGQGSTFTISIPFEVPESVALEDEKSTSVDLTPGLRILVAEDHVVNQKVMRAILSTIDCDLTIVGNGAEAVAAVQNTAFDLVLMDIQMPVLDGLTAIEQIRAFEAENQKPRLPIAALSANVMTHHVAASLKAGADGHYGKPITPAELIEAVHELSLLGQDTVTAPQYVAL